MSASRGAACVALNCFPLSLLAPFAFVSYHIALKLHLKFKKKNDNENRLGVSHICLMSLLRVDESQFRTPARSPVLKPHSKGDKLDRRSWGRRCRCFKVGLRLLPIAVLRIQQMGASSVHLFGGEGQFVFFNTKGERPRGINMLSPVPSR